MGTITEKETQNGRRQDGLSTATLIMAAIRLAGRPLTTYEIGLDVLDDHVPPRPISVIIKSLAKDKYVKSTGRSGKRIARWDLTERGHASLDKRPAAFHMATSMIGAGISISEQERMIERAVESGARTISEIATATGLTTSPIRTGLRRIDMRRRLRRI